MREETRTFTVREILDAAAEAKLPNTNYSFVSYKAPEGASTAPQYEGHKPVMACVIGEAFLNLGMVPDGFTPDELSSRLHNVGPDKKYRNYVGNLAIGDYEISNLGSFFNILNGVEEYRGKKRLVRMARKYFSESLDQEITLHSRYY